ncbi:MAG: cbb3-type cytochrome oxidase assembly protein CcoS [Rhodobacteraceae bacterium]|nr:cbb3-type cytochrome oxidase assembly protein CcoS [Paracoccaceae bacterium]
MGGVGLLGFVWTLKNRQYDDPEGDGQRFLRKDWDDRPKP